MRYIIFCVLVQTLYPAEGAKGTGSWHFQVDTVLAQNTRSSNTLVCGVPYWESMRQCGGAVTAVRSSILSSDSQIPWVTEVVAWHTTQWEGSIAAFVFNWGSNVFASGLEPFGLRDHHMRRSMCCVSQSEGAWSLPQCTTGPPKRHIQFVYPHQFTSRIKKSAPVELGIREAQHFRALQLRDDPKIFASISGSQKMKARISRARTVRTLDNTFGLQQQRGPLLGKLFQCRKEHLHGIYLYSDLDRRDTGRRLCALEQLARAAAVTEARRHGFWEPQREAAFLTADEIAIERLARADPFACNLRARSTCSSDNDVRAPAVSHATRGSTSSGSRATTDPDQCDSWRAEPPVSHILLELQSSIRSSGLENKDASTACLFLPPFETTP